MEVQGQGRVEGKGAQVQGRGYRVFKEVHGEGCRSKERMAGIKGGCRERGFPGSPPPKGAHQKGFRCEHILITLNALKLRLKTSRAFLWVGDGFEDTPSTPTSSSLFFQDFCEAKAGLCSKLKF